MQKKSIYQKIANLIENNKINEAETLLNQVISKGSMLFVAFHQLGYIRQIQGRMEDAKELYLRSQSINPDFEQAKHFLEKLNKLIITINEFNPDPNAIYAYWYNQNSNWGDAVNRVLMEQLSGKKVIWVAPFDYRVPVKYTIIGSVMTCADANTIVWGTGVMSKNHPPLVRPKQIYAVRGPLTKKILNNLGIDCPAIYGDPALLFPRFYNPEVKKKYDIGIIAHYVDQQHTWLKYAESKGAKIINILGDIYQVVDDIKSCSRIASSSLHGIIAADAYGIPSSWVEFSDGVIGNGFKFRDYYLSINRPVPKPLRVKNKTRIEELDKNFNVHGIDIDLDLLLDCCPFTDGSVINKIG